MTSVAPSPRSVKALTALHGELHVFPVSFQQQRFWLLDQIDGDAAAYTIPLALRLDGALDVDALERALQLIVARHESLRTVFALENGEAVQVVLPHLDLALSLEDLSGAPRADREREVARRVQQNANAPFDLTAGPLVRAAVLRLGATEHILLFTLHHIIADGWSVGVLLRELDAAYSAHAAGRSPVLPELSLQYADYAVWQRRAMSGAAAARQLDYWASRLQAVPALELPVDRPRPRVQTLVGAKREAIVAPAVADAVRTLARSHGATPYMTCLAAFVAVLHRYSGQTDFAVGSIASGRRQAALEPLIGLFVNTLALRVTPAPDESFAAFLGRVRDTAIDAMANQDVPFEQVVERVQPARDHSRHPIFQVAFQLLDGLAEAPRLGALRVSSVTSQKETAKFELTLVVRTAADGGFVTVAEYNTDLFDAATIDRLLAHYGVLLAAAARDASTPVGRLPLVDAEEQAQLASFWNPAPTPLPSWSVPERVLALARATPDAPAIRAGDETLTYRELARRSSIVACRLAALGVGAGDRVAVCVSRDATLPVSLLGVLRTGAAYVPIDPDYPAERIAYVAGDAGVRAVLTDPGASRALPPLEVPILSLDAPSWRESVDEREALAAVPHDAESLAYVLYTSGSTGRPKGVMIPHRALANFLASMAEQPGLAAGDSVVAVTTISFDIAGLELWLPLTTGAEVVVVPRDVAVDGAALRTLLERTAERVAGKVLLQATPATWRLLLEAGWAGTSKLVMLCGGEAWTAGLAAALRTRGAALWNVYGPTETTIWSTRALIAGDDVPLGEPLANTTLYVLEPSGEPAPLGVPGELWIGGAGLALGYHARPELTAQRFVAHARFGRLYRTGDLVRRTADGRLHYLGRLDDQVKLRGFRIELGEIESALAAQPGVAQAVAAVRGAGSDARLVAYVVAGPAGPALRETTLADALRRTLPDYMVPSAIVQLEALPLTPNGKVDRRALPEPQLAAAETRPYVAPRTPLEARLAETWQEVLGVERVGVDDDFFALGGHSLLAMRVVARLDEWFPVRPTIALLFEARTVAGLAARAVENGHGARGVEDDRASSTPTVVPRGDIGSAPLTYGQERLWVQAQIADSAAYNVPTARRVRGPLDVAALERAVSAVVARHESLRSRITEEAEGVRQHVLPAPLVVIEQHDLRSSPAEAREEAARQWLSDAAARRFDLGMATVPRVALVRLGDEEWILLLVAHHIVCDGASLGVLWRELALAYAAELRKAAPASTAPALQIGDVAVWERDASSDARLAAALAFWRPQLAGAPTESDLPLDFPRRSAEGPAARARRVLPRALQDDVHRLARELGVTPFMVLVTAYAALLGRWSGQRDVVIGTPVSGRHRPELRDVVGHLANTVALRAQLHDDPTFAELLARTRTAAAGALEHQDVSFDRVANALRAENATAGRFNVAFVQQDAVTEPVTQLGAARLDGYAIDSGAAKFDLTLSAVETEDGVRASLEYRADLFDAATADALLARYERLLTALVRAPETKVSRAPLLSAEERSLILGEWRGRTVPYPRDATIHAMVAAHARRSPDAIAVVDGARTLTYAELDARANRLANRLRALGVRRDVTVALCVKRSAEMVVAALAILKAGGAYVPLDPSNPPARLALMLADARPRVVLAEQATRAAIPLDALDAGARPPLLLLDADAADIDREPATPPASDADATSLAYVIYTSGSTGTPKGVAAVHRGVVRLVANPTYVQLGPAETLLSFAPLTFDASTLELWGALCTGGRLVIFPGHTPSLEELGDVIASQGVTTLWLTAALFHQFVDGHLEGLRPLRQLLAGGDVLSVPHVRRVLEAMPGLTLINGYGPTENTTFTCCHPMRAATFGATVPIGRPIGNTTVYILDEWMQPVPWGVPGRLYTGGDGLARGYLGRPDLTAERFRPDPFATAPTSDAESPTSDAESPTSAAESPTSDASGARIYDTGDLARWRADGTIEFLGRADTQLKIRGFRIEPGEVEAALLAESDVKEAVVVGRADERGAKRLVAYVVPTPGARIDGTALRLRLAERLPDYLVPSLVVALDALPLTESGKVDRRALPDPVAGAEVDEAPPRDDIERVVARTWGDALGRAPRSVTASFFDLGGDSLLAIRIVTQLHKVFRVRLPLRRFFDDPTIAGVARAIVAAEGKPGQVAAIAALMMRIQNMTPEERERLRRENARPDQSTR